MTSPKIAALKADVNTLARALASISDEIDALQKPAAPLSKADRAAIEAERANAYAALSLAQAKGDAPAEVLARVRQLDWCGASDEERAARLSALVDAGNALNDRHAEAHQKLGKAVLSDLRAELNDLADKRTRALDGVERAQVAAVAARDEENAARKDIAAKLTEWPDLARDAASTYPPLKDREPSPGFVLFDAYAKFLEALDRATGRVPSVVAGQNIAGLLSVTPDEGQTIASFLAGHGSIPSHKRDAILAARRALRDL